MKVQMWYCYKISLWQWKWHSQNIRYSFMSHKYPKNIWTILYN
jgi:hypothetical protein